MPTTNTKQQQTAETFTKPNSELVDPSTGMDEEDIKLHNDETLLRQSGKPDNYVQVREIFTDGDADPINEALTEKERNRIAGYTVRQYQEELDKEKMAKIGFMIWQSKQLFYTAFRRIGWNEEHQKIEWEQRDYTYHKLTSAQKMELKKDEALIKGLVNKNSLLERGFVNESLYNFITNRETEIDVEIEELREAWMNKKFSFYFLEEDKTVLDDIGFVDKRDLVEAAEYRETGVPFSRKLVSYPTMSESGGAKVKSR